MARNHSARQQRLPTRSSFPGSIERACPNAWQNAKVGGTDRSAGSSDAIAHELSVAAHVHLQRSEHAYIISLLMHRLS